MNALAHKLLNTKHLTLILLFLLAFTERVFFDLGPNIELITMSMILASYYFGRKEAFWLIFATIAFSDRFIGNSSIFLFTWSGFLIPALLASNFIKHIKKLITDHQSPITKKIFYCFSLTSIGLASNIFFYLWTNLGVWYLDSFNMYPNTFSGLAMSYVNALPFLRLHLTSTLIFVPAGFLLYESVRFLLTKHLPFLTSAKKSF
jgi:hypothetical protein